MLLRAIGTACAALATFCAAAPAGHGPPPRDSVGDPPRKIAVRITPEAGGPSTRFLVSFRARNELRGPRFYDIEATGPEGRGCDNDSAYFRHARRGQQLRIWLPNRRYRPNWCTGHYAGTVWVVRDHEDPDRFREKVVGRFSFEVTAPPAPAPRSSPRAATGASGTASPRTP